MPSPPMTSALAAADPAPTTPAHPKLILAARGVCAALAVICVAAVCSMIVAGPRGMSGGAYAGFLALQVASAVLLGFLAAYRPDAHHTPAFASVAMAATTVVA